MWEDTTLAQLHTILQIVMGWEDYHLHQFVIGRRLYSVPDPDDTMYERKVVDENRILLLEVVPRVGTEFTYLYDFGDSWEHDLILEAILLPEKNAQYPTSSTANAALPRKMSGERPGMKNTWRSWPILTTRNMAACCNGEVRSIQSVRAGPSKPRSREEVSLAQDAKSSSLG